MKKLFFILPALLFWIMAGCSKGGPVDPPVVIVPPPIEPKIISFSVTPETVIFGQPVLVSWDAVNVVEVRIKAIPGNFNGSSSSPNGSVMASTSESTTTFICIGLAGNGKADTAYRVVVVKLQQDKVIALSDLRLEVKASTRKNWEDALKGEGNWVLPNIEQSKLLYERKTQLSDILVPLNYWDQTYWTSSLPPDSDSLLYAQVVDFKTGPPQGFMHVGLKTDKHNVLLVRSF